ncbi:hypothetical protein ABGB17_27585 [Sphaerisporangium sp. B11E5]|uniref:hypothetical protein n=1 Tax=Sphaerisporangium sp. B11E5 TaxID=3153563 RepID=UPI00325D53FA
MAYPAQAAARRAGVAGGGSRRVVACPARAVHQDTRRTYFPFDTEDHEHRGHTLRHSQAGRASSPGSAAPSGHPPVGAGHLQGHGYACHAPAGTLSGAGGPGRVFAVDAGTGKISS